MAGIAAGYATLFGDPLQLSSDAADFYYLAANRAEFTLTEIERITVGSGAVLIWQQAYDLADAVGLGRARHIGVLMNILAVSLAGVFTVKAGRHLVGNDPVRLSVLIAMFSLCGLYWLFASIHLRDAVVLLGVRPSNGARV